LKSWKRQEREELQNPISRRIAIELGLVDEISDIEYQEIYQKQCFYYTAEERVDFRELIKPVS